MQGGTNKSRRELERVGQSLNGSKQMIAILEVNVPVLHRRDEERTGPDGYPASTGGSSESTTTTRNVSSSTETAGLRLAERGVEPDALHHNRVRADAMILEARGLLATAASLVLNGLKLGETERGRQSSLTVCANPYCARVIAGTEHDRPRSGRCDTAGHRCYRNWTRYGRDIKPEQQDDEDYPPS